jgi:hypothetical protein
MLEVRGRTNQAGDFLAAQHHWQRLRDTHRTHLVHQLAVVERDLEEELQPSDRGIERDRRDALIDQVQLIAPQILDTGRVRRAPEEASKLAHRAVIAVSNPYPLAVLCRWRGQDLTLPVESEILTSKNEVRFAAVVRGDTRR